MFGLIKTQLSILQLEGYELLRFLSWWLRHPTTSHHVHKKPLVYTPKLKWIIFIWLGLVVWGVLIFQSIFATLLFITTSVLLPGAWLCLSVLVLKPYEIWNRRRVRNRIKKRLVDSDITTVGITGSFGKTSIKDFLSTILSEEMPTVKTPDSYNTVFGVAKTVDFEIIKKTKVFLCEMGAYKIGEIKEICDMVCPDYAILSAIGTQHLERFRLLSNTTKAKFELIDAVSPKNALVNLDNSFISEQLKLERYKGVRTYSLKNKSADFYTSNIRRSGLGYTFEMSSRGVTESYRTKLFGTSNIYNLTAAISMSKLLGLSKEKIQQGLDKIRPSAHRLELKVYGKSILIDNAFSSNEEGFKAILDDLKMEKGKKVIITPGIVELGSRLAEVHKEMGVKISEVFEEVILVGDGERIKYLESGISSKVMVKHLSNNSNLWIEIDNLAKKYDWILLENDLPQNY